MGNYFARGRLIKILSLLLLIVTACVRVPQHDLAVQMESAGLNKVSSCDFAIGEGPKEEWWKDFNDPVLNWLVEAGLKQSPTLKIAEERLKSANQSAIQVASKLYPEINFLVDNTYLRLSKQGLFRGFSPQIPPVVNDAIIGFTFTYEFDFWGKNRKLFESALSQSQALAAESMQAELIVTTSIAYSYATLQFLLKQKELVEKRLNNQAGITSIRTDRIDNALDNALSKLKSEASSLDFEAMVLALQQDIEIELHQLKALTGLGQDAELNIALFHLNTIQVTLPENLTLELIARRPDLIALRARAEAAAKEVGAAKTDFYPNINLYGLIGLDSIHWSSIFRAHNFTALIPLVVQLPIFTAGRIKAQLKQKVADFNEAVYAYNDLILKSAQEVADHLSDILLLQKQIDVRKKSLLTALKEEKITLHRFEEALDDNIALRKARDVVLESEIQLITLEYGKQLEAILLIRALGGGYGK